MLKKKDNYSTKIYDALIAAGLIRVLYSTYTDIGIETSYSDEQHPKITQRFTSLYSYASKDNEISNFYKNILLYFQSIMKRIDDTYNRPKIELQASRKIDDAFFQQRNIVTENNGVFCRTVLNDELIQNKFLSSYIIDGNNYSSEWSKEYLFSINNQNTVVQFSDDYEFYPDGNYSTLQVAGTNLKLSFLELYKLGRKLLREQNISFFTKKCSDNQFKLFFRSKVSSKVFMTSILVSENKIDTANIIEYNLEKYNSNITPSEVSVIYKSKNSIPVLYFVQFEKEKFNLFEDYPFSKPKIILSNNYAMYNDKVDKDFLNGIFGDQEDKIIATEKDIIVVKDIIYTIKFDDDKVKVFQTFLPLTKLFKVEASRKSDIIIFAKQGGRRLLFFPSNEDIPN